MNFILLRVDGSRHLGMGHVMRCIGLAQGMEKKGVHSIFVVRNYEKKIIELIQNHGYQVETIPSASSFIEDALLTSKFSSHYGVGLIVTDLGNNDSMSYLNEYNNYLQALKTNCKFLITIDGVCKIKFPSDIVIDPYYRIENIDYNCTGSTKYLLGPKYFIFRQEFIDATKVTRNIKRRSENILVTLGGSDPFNITFEVAKALTKLNMESLNLKIVIGKGFISSAKDDLENIFKNFEGNYELIMGNDYMADLMLWSDLAIIGGGLTKYETSITGTPSIAISQFDSEAKMTDVFERCGTMLHLGLISEIAEKDIVKSIEKVLNDYHLRMEMSIKGKKLFDGKGIERIISEIPKEILFYG